MNSLGIYFGPRLIGIVETKGKSLLNSIQILQSAVTAGELEEKVPSEVKIVALFKDELRKNKIEAKEASLVLSGKDLVIRTFEMPPVPGNELESAVRFEAKKYIPFRIEDLITDFQVQYDKSSHKNIVLFIGIKKEILEKYLSILAQLDIAPVAIEYSAFSVLRLLRASGFSDKGIISVISVDFKEEDEVNFTVLENGFPLFSRDITLLGGPEEFTSVKEKDYGIILEKLKTEIRVSLDYYHRKFPGKNIAKAFFISSQEYRNDFGAFIKDMDLSAQFIDVAKLIGKATPFSLSIVKSYSVSLSRIIKSSLKVNLLIAKEKAKKREPVPITIETIPSLFAGLQVNVKVVIIGVLICVATFVFGIVSKQPLDKEVNEIISKQPKVAGVNSGLPNEELSRVNAEYKRKIEVFDNLINGQVYLTKIIETAARVKPPGIWLNDFTFKREQSKTDLVLGGMAYLTDSDKEFALVNKYLANLKENAVFTKYFRDINISSLDHKQFKKVTVTTFVISCRAAKKERE